MLQKSATPNGGACEIPPDPTVAFTVSGWTETAVTGVDFPVTTPLIGTVTDSIVTIADIPVGGTVDTSLLITPDPADTFVPFDQTPITASFDVLTAFASTQTISVPFAPGAVYGTRGDCNLEQSTAFITLTLLGDEGSQPIDLLTDGRYLFSGLAAGTYTLEVFDFELGGVQFPDTLELTGTAPATLVDLAEFCSLVIPG